MIPEDQKQSMPCDCPKLIPEENYQDKAQEEGTQAETDSPLSWKDRSGGELRRVGITVLSTREEWVTEKEDWII